MNFQVIAFQKQQKKPHWYGTNIYVVSCISKLSATSGKVEIQTLRTLVDVSLLFFFKLTAYLLSVCIVDTNASMTFFENLFVEQDISSNTTLRRSRLFVEITSKDHSSNVNLSVFFL